MGELGKKMISFSKRYGDNIYSQNGEDGIVLEILRRIKILKGVSVEFGGHDGSYCSNTKMLKDAAWTSYMYDVVPLSKDVEHKMITPDNVNELPQCNVLSIDVDGEDYEIWKAYTGKPEIVIIEVNSSFPPDVYHYSKQTGCSYALMAKLGEDKGYFLLCHCGNMVFVDKKFKSLFPEIVGDPIKDSKLFFNKSWLQQYA